MARPARSWAPWTSSSRSSVPSWKSKHKLLDFLREEGVLAADLAARMRRWHHSGFSVHNRIRNKAADAEGRQRLARF